MSKLIRYAFAFFSIAVCFCPPAAASRLDFLNPFAAAGAAFVVDNDADGADVFPGDGICRDAADNCTLRAAIEEANALPGADSINFSIDGVGVRTIVPATPLPAITEALSIDGYSQPGASENTQPTGGDAVLLIEIRGDALPSGFHHGLRVYADNCLVKGLIVNRFSDSGISFSGSNITIAGNFIGTNFDGTADVGNAFDGIAGAGSNNTIGGADPSARNLISGNNRYGVSLGDASSNNKIQGNYIGTNVLGNLALPNGSNGVHLFRASRNQIGGAGQGEGNLISGNGGNGVYVFADNVFPSVQANAVAANLIGTNFDGATAIPNAGNGIYVFGSKDNRIGAGNTVSGNALSGVRIEGAGATGNVVDGNRIGTNLTGASSIANTQEGVLVAGANANLIGGSTVAARNVISGNGGGGINIAVDAGGAHPSGNHVKGNFIGTDAAGVVAVPNGTLNQGSGISLFRADSNQIGGSAAGEGNLVAGNAASGIGGFRANNNVYQGNFVGLSSAGNVLPNNGYGVIVTDCVGTIINGANYISGNEGRGLWIRDVSRDTIVQGNFIGVNAQNQPRGNGSDGIWVTERAHGNQIGGAGAGQGNVIAHNLGSGISIATLDGAVRVKISGNRIHDNLGLGIDLGEDGVTANDATDADDGANRLQNYPVLVSAVAANDSTNVQGNLSSAPDSTFTVDFFWSTSPDASGHGEGEIYLGSLTVSTDANGNAAFAGQMPQTAGGVISATATDADGNTSEFSEARAVTFAPTAATVTVGGQVTTTGGRGVYGALVEMIDAGGNVHAARTNPFGYYRFSGVAAGATYVFAARHKSYEFTPASQIRVIDADDENINFSGAAQRAAENYDGKTAAAETGTYLSRSTKP